MIGKSGKYYRAGYLARQAGDWPDNEGGNAGEEEYDDTPVNSGPVDDMSAGARPLTSASAGENVPAPVGQQSGAQIKTQALAKQSRPSNGVTTCRGEAQFTGVGGNQARGDGALLSPFPKAAGGSIKGGTFGTVAVRPGFLGLDKPALRHWGNQIFVTPEDGGRSAQFGGPSGALSVSDYNNDSTQTGPNTHIDIYRFPTKSLGDQYGRKNFNATISFPTASGGKCPVGWKQEP